MKRVLILLVIMGITKIAMALVTAMAMARHHCDNFSILLRAATNLPGSRSSLAKLEFSLSRRARARFQKAPMVHDAFGNYICCPVIVEKVSVMRSPNLIASFLIAVTITSCAGRQVITSKITPDEYKNLAWENKISFFESIDVTKNTFPSREIYLSAMKDPVPGVVISALRSLPDRHTPDYKSALYLLLKYKNPVVRMFACQRITVVPSIEDLSYLQVLFADRDWMPRECVFQNIRNYSHEKNEKKYFFTIISFLHEKNSQVLRQIYKTLKWYEDPRTIAFLYKRSFLNNTTTELMVIMQELIEIRSEKIKQRIVYLSLNHPDYFVKKEAQRLLGKM